MAKINILLTNNNNYYPSIDPPEVTTIEPHPVGIDGFVQLICVATGTDPADNITWTFGDSLYTLPPK